jgi:Mg-chelatase subunit ChlD
MLDTSGSIYPADFDLAKTFISDIASSLTDVGSGQRVAMITYSTIAKLLWNLDGIESDSGFKLLNAIASKVMQIKGNTNTADALEMCGKDVFGSAADRPAAPNVAVLLTDGQSK